MCFCIRLPLRYILSLSVVVVSLNLLNAAPPTTNPVADYYGGPEGYPAWTAAIAWGQVIDMKSYTQGSNDFEKFENARDELAARGGGVLYYPGGTYDFSALPTSGPQGRGLMLKAGVVIRGEAPLQDRDGRDGTLGLTTKFIFPSQSRGGSKIPGDWNIIGMQPRDNQKLSAIDNIGIVWVHCTGATLYWGPDLVWGKSYATAGGWKSAFVKQRWKNRIPDGTHPHDPFCGGTREYGGVGSGRLVMGCQLDDAAVVNDVYDEGAGPDGFYMDKFGARIAVYGKNVFIANNTLPQSSKNFAYMQKTCNTVQSSGCAKKCDGTPQTKILFDYGKTMGIDVNKSLLGYVSSNAGLLEPGVVVRDNYVYNHGHKGFDVAGSWVTIAHNKNQRDYLSSGADPYGIGGWKLTLDGYLQSAPGGPGCISDNLSRSFDIAGQHVWIDNNWFTNTGSNPGNDGEGILCQAWAGTQIWSWAITHNTHVRGSGENGYMGGYDVKHLGCLNAWNTTPGFVGSENNKSSGLIDCAFVNNTAAGGVKTSSAAGQPSDVITQCPSASQIPPLKVSVAVEHNDHVVIGWSDASDTEIGFRVDRKIAQGPWAAIAYRPRKSSGSSYNPQAWHDYTAPPNQSLTYRVVAIGCDDSDGGASPPSETVRITVSTTAVSTVSRAPLAQRLSYTFNNKVLLFNLHTATAISVTVYALSGRALISKHLSTNRQSAALDVHALAAGVYLVRATVNNQALLCSPLIVKQ